MYKITKENLRALFREIAGSRELYLPVEMGGQVNFGVWDEDAKVRLDVLKTVKSPKDIFFPQAETLYTCTGSGKNIRIKPQELKDRDFVVFGMRACDVRGVKVLDQVFLSDPQDTYYAARRAHGILVSMACGRPEESCFCSTFGIDAAAPEGDVAAWMTEKDLFLKPLTEKGEQFITSVESLLTKATPQRLWKRSRSGSGRFWKNCPTGIFP